MFKISCSLLLAAVLISPASWAAFHVYTGNLQVYERDTAVRYGEHGISKDQCLRSRYGRVNSKWPCVIDRAYIPGDVQANRLFIYTKPYRDKEYSPGFKRLIATKP